MHKKCLIYGLIFTLLNLPVLVSAQEGIDLGQVVVSATKLEEKVETLPSSVTVITKEEIQKKKTGTVSDLLRTVPGLDVASSGGSGKLTSVYVRGANSGHVLVLIDGVQVNSPTSGNYDFGNLLPDNIERIEVVRGAQSTLYGSDAIGGVINIITRKGTGKPKVSLTTEGGSFETSKEAASFTFGNDVVDFSFAASHLETEGISALNQKTFPKSDPDSDGYKNDTFSSKLGLQLSANTRLEGVVRYTDASSEIDISSGKDHNYVQDSQELVSAVNLQQEFGNFWEHLFKFQLMKTDSRYTQPEVPKNNSEIDTRIRQVEWQHNVHLFKDADTLTFGVEYEQQDGEYKNSFDRSIRNRAGYIQNQLNLLDDALNIVVGARIDKNSQFGKKGTYKAGISYLLKPTNTRFKANYGTAFKAPTLNNLYYPNSWGNPDLKPEESRGYDVGVEQRCWDNRAFFAATYFHNTFENLINYQLVSRPYYQNIAEAASEGVELETGVKPVEQLQIKVNYTETRAKNKVTDKALNRRPEHKANLSVDINPQKDLNINFTLNYVGKRWNDAANAQNLAAYVKLDLAASYNLTEYVQIFGRIENLLDEKYEEVLGYNTTGTAFYGGVKVTF